MEETRFQVSRRAMATILLSVSAGWTAVDMASARSSVVAQEEQPAGTTEEPVPWQRPQPPAAQDRIKERQMMVRMQLAAPTDSRTPVRDSDVLAAMEAVPRHAFVPEKVRHLAYDDRALPIGHAQTISQPYIVGLMSELLEIDEESRVLEIGTGSGYQAAILAYLTPHVYSIEIVEALAEQAAKNLRAQGYEDVHLRQGDGYLGWPEAAPFDAIIVTCAPDHLPEPLWEQLKPGGRIVIPVGEQLTTQDLVVVEKTEQGERRSRTITGVRFVPLTR